MPSTEVTNIPKILIGSYAFSSCGASCYRPILIMYTTVY